MTPTTPPNNLNALFIRNILLHFCEKDWAPERSALRQNAVGPADPVQTLRRDRISTWPVTPNAASSLHSFPAASIRTAILVPLFLADPPDGSSGGPQAPCEAPRPCGDRERCDGAYFGRERFLSKSAGNPRKVAAGGRRSSPPPLCSTLLRDVRHTAAVLRASQTRRRINTRISTHRPKLEVRPWRAHANVWCGWWARGDNRLDVHDLAADLGAPVEDGASVEMTLPKRCIDDHIVDDTVVEDLVQPRRWCPSRHSA